MKIGIFSAVLVCAFAAATQAQLLSVNFGSGYADGDLVGQNGWALTGTTTGNKLNISGGAAILVAGQTGEDVYKAFTTVAPTTSNTSLDTHITFSVTSATSGGDYFFHLSDPVGTTTFFYQRLYVKSFEDGFVLGLVATSGTGSTVTYGTTKLSLNTSYTADIIWNFVEGPLNDTFTVSVDGAQYLTHTWNTATAEPTGLSAVNLRQGGSTTTPGVSVTSISVVAVPEPGTVALVGLGLGAVLLGARRRARR